MATVFSTKDPNPGVWFKFDENDPESGEIRIRVMNNKSRKLLEKECVKKKVEHNRHGRFAYDEPDEDKFSRMLWDYCIVEWNNLEDDDGNLIVCTTEKKTELMQENVGFASFVGACLEILAKEEEDRVARIGKNSLSGPKGSKKSQAVKGAVS